MRDVNPPDRDSSEDDDLERSLERGLHRQPLSTEAFERIRANLLVEFRQQNASAARQPRTRRYVAIAAAACALAIGVLLVRSYLSSDAVVARLETETGAGVLDTSGAQYPHRVGSGAVLHASERWETQGSALARLTSGGTLRLASGTVVQAKDSRTLELATGRVYLDFPPGAGRFIVHTAFGSIEHVGTQFEVMALDASVRVRVRDGRVLMHGEKRDLTIDTGMEVVVDRDGRIKQSVYPTYGGDWAWVEAIAPLYDINNRQLTDFLIWVARETGRQITFVDARARETADHTTLHGSVQGLRPMDALDQVLSTTSLRFELRSGEIRIASRG